MDELVSIIIPIYNCEKTVEKCICSLQNQTYTNIEIIIVDDGSVDSSSEIVKKMAGYEPRIHYIFISNSGVSHARNVGLLKAKGKYIGFVDGDDYVHKEFVETLIRGFNRDNIQLSMTNYKKISKEDSSELPITEEVVENYIFKSNQVIEGILLSKGNFRGFVWNKLFLANVLKNKNISFNEKLTYMEDMEFVIRYLKHCNLISVNGKQLYYYVFFEDSATNKLGVENLSLFSSIDIIKSNLTSSYETSINYLYIEMYIIFVNRSLKHFNFKVLKELKKIYITKEMFKD